MSIGKSSLARAAKITFGFALALCGSGSRTCGQDLINHQPSGMAKSQIVSSEEKPRFVRLKLVHLLDKTAFVEDVEALRVLVPADWKFEGQVTWHPENKGCADAENLASIAFRATSPDGSAYFEELPSAYWLWLENKSPEDAARFSQCTLREPSLEDYILKTLLPRWRPGAKIISSEPLPEFSRALTDRLARNITPPLYPGLRQTSKGECVRFKYELSGGWGSAQESLYAQQVTVLEQKPIYDAHRSLQKYENLYVIHAGNFHAVRLPGSRSSLSEAAVARILLSVHFDEKWIAGRKELVILLRHNKELPEGTIPRIKLPEAQESSSAERRAKELADFRLSLAREYYSAAVPLELFLNPRTNQRISLDGGFAAAWANDKDEFILTNDSSFDPSAESREAWTRLSKVSAGNED